MDLPRHAVASLAVRTGLGLTFVSAGWDHIFENHVILQAVSFLPDPQLWADLLSWGELLAGLALLAGLLTPLAAWLAVVVNVGAILTYGARGSFLAADVAMVGAGLWLLARGAGSWSLDAFLARGAWSERALAPFAAEPAASRAQALMRVLLGVGLLYLGGRTFAHAGFAVLGSRVAPDAVAVVGFAAALAGALFVAGVGQRMAAALVVAVTALAVSQEGLRLTTDGWTWELWSLAGAAVALAMLGPGAGALHHVLARWPALRSDRQRIAAPLLVVALLLSVTVLAGASSSPPPSRLSSTMTWTERTVLLGDATGYSREGEPWVGHVPVKDLVLKGMVARLTWDDESDTAPDTFTLELVPPPGLTAGPPAEGSSGELHVAVPVYAAPPRGGAQVGAGDWTVRVYLRSAGDGTIAGVLPGTVDAGNAWTLKVTAVVFEPAPAGR